MMFRSKKSTLERCKAITVHLIERNVEKNETVDHGQTILAPGDQLNINDNAPHPPIIIENIGGGVLKFLLVTNEPRLDKPIYPKINPPSLNLVGLISGPKTP